MIKPRTLLATSLSLCTLSGVMLLASAGFYLSSECAQPSDDVVHVEEVAVPELAVTAQTFPREFTGEFAWHADTEATSSQTVRLRVEDVSARGDLLIATGRGFTDFTYFEDVPTTFDFRIEVDKVTGEFEMWESNPSRVHNYVIDGKYTATLLRDVELDRVNATWRGDDGQDGTLTLTPVRPCHMRSL